MSIGLACCVAAEDRTIMDGASREIVQMNAGYSPLWSFRWDNRGCVAGEETSVNWSSEGSPLDGFPQKSPIFERNAETMRFNASDRSRPTSLPLEESRESPAVSDSPPTNQSPSVGSVSLFPSSPLSSQSDLLPTISSWTRWPHHPPGHQLLQQVSNCQIPGHNLRDFPISEDTSSFPIPGWSNESTRGSNAGSSDDWSVPAFSELVAASHGQRSSVDGEFCGFNIENISRSGSWLSASNPIDMQACGICSKLLADKSFYEFAVVAVLICGHVYHAECLESMTPEISKYDPACPICSFGEKQLVKLSEKVFMFSKGSNTKSSLDRPFLRRQFSFRSKGSRSPSENLPPRRKGFFWSKPSPLDRAFPAIASKRSHY